VPAKRNPTIASTGAGAAELIGNNWCRRAGPVMLAVRPLRGVHRIPAASACGTSLRSPISRVLALVRAIRPAPSFLPPPRSACPRPVSDSPAAHHDTRGGAAPHVPVARRPSPRPCLRAATGCGAGFQSRAVDSARSRCDVAGGVAAGGDTGTVAWAPRGVTRARWRGRRPVRSSHLPVTCARCGQRPSGWVEAFTSG
jgi:hypothetical protein